MQPEERKEITDAFRHELGMFSKNKIAPLVHSVQEIGTRVISHAEKLAAHEQRIKDAEKDVEGIERDVETVAESIEIVKGEHKSDFVRVLIIVISALMTILAAVVGLGYWGKI